MRLLLYPLALWIGLALGAAQEGNSLKIDASDIGKLTEGVGETATVEGLIDHTAKTGSGVQFLNFESGFKVVIFAQNVAAFAEGQPVDLFRGKWVKVTGEISVFRGSPQIKVSKPEQILIINAPEVISEVKIEAEPEEVIPKVEEKPETPAKPEIQTDGDVELVDGKPPVDGSSIFLTDFLELSLTASSRRKEISIFCQKVGQLSCPTGIICGISSR